MSTSKNSTKNKRKATEKRFYSANFGISVEAANATEAAQKIEQQLKESKSSEEGDGES